MLRAAARGAGLDHEPVPVRAWFDGGPFIALVRALGGRVLLTEQFNGWVAGDPGRHWPAHYGPFAQGLSLERACVDDFQGAVLVELDGAKYVAVRTDAVLDPPYISAALIIGAPSLEDALSLLDRMEAKRDELAGASVRVPGCLLACGPYLPGAQDRAQPRGVVRGAAGDRQVASDSPAGVSCLRPKSGRVAAPTAPLVSWSRRSRGLARPRWR